MPTTATATAAVASGLLLRPWHLGASARHRLGAIERSWFVGCRGQRKTERRRFWFLRLMLDFGVDCGDSVDCGLLSCMGWVALVDTRTDRYGRALESIVEEALPFVVFYSRFFFLYVQNN